MILLVILYSLQLPKKMQIILQIFYLPCTYLSCTQIGVHFIYLTRYFFFFIIEITKYLPMIVDETFYFIIYKHNYKKSICSNTSGGSQSIRTVNNVIILNFKAKINHLFNKDFEQCDFRYIIFHHFQKFFLFA